MPPLEELQKICGLLSYSVIYLHPYSLILNHQVQSISVAFEHCVLRVVVAYCVARQRGKNYQFSQLRNITGSKGRLNIPFPWQSMKLFTTKSCYATTTRNTQCSNAMEIDCTQTPLNLQ